MHMAIWSGMFQTAMCLRQREIVMSKNALGKLEYLFYIIWFQAISMYWYRTFCFRSLNSLTVQQSKLILWGITGGSLIILICVTWKKRRNFTELFLTLVFAYGLYALITYADHFKVFALISLAAAVALSVLLIVIAFSEPPKRSKRFSVYIRMRLRTVLLCTRTVSALCLAPFFAFVAVISFLDMPLIKPTENVIDMPAIQEATISNNMTTVQLLNEEEWTRLSEQERLDVLQVIANIEAHYLGIPYTPTVEAAVLDTNTLGTYSHSERSIKVSIDSLKNGTAHDALKIVAHESYHSYQHCLVELFLMNEEYQHLLLFSGIKEYADEFTHYKDGGTNTEDFYEYYFQTVEIDARNYAVEAVSDYYSRISN